MSLLTTTIITFSLLALISTGLNAWANHSNKKEDSIKPTWAIIDGEYITFTKEERA